MVKKLYLLLKLAILVVATNAKLKSRVPKTNLNWAVGFACRPNEFVAKGAGCGSSKYYVCKNSNSGKWKLEEQSCHRGCCFHSEKEECFCKNTQDRGIRVRHSKMLPVESLLALDASEFSGSQWRLSDVPDFMGEELHDQFGWNQLGKIKEKMTTTKPSSSNGQLKEGKRTKEQPDAIKLTTAGPEEQIADVKVKVTPTPHKIYTTRKHRITTREVGKASSPRKHSAKKSESAKEEPKLESREQISEESTTGAAKSESKKIKHATVKPEKSHVERQQVMITEESTSKADGTERSVIKEDEFVEYTESIKNKPTDHKSKTAIKKSKKFQKSRG